MEQRAKRDAAKTGSIVTVNQALLGERKRHSRPEWELTGRRVLDRVHFGSRAFKVKLSAHATAAIGEPCLRRWVRAEL